MTPGSVIRVDTSSKRDTKPSSRSSKLFAISLTSPVLVVELAELALYGQALLALLYVSHNLCVNVE